MMQKQESVYIDQLKSFVSFPTVSSDSSKKGAIIKCALWLTNHLLSIGLQKAKAFQTTSHPVVYAEYISNPSYQTILFYGHYDVQPADPLEKWSSPPFEAVVKDMYMFGRGASDDKGQVFIHIKAVEQLLKNNWTLPVNIKFLIEGAEEIGSAGLKDFVLNHKDLLRCNVAVVSDTKMLSLHTPAITYSLRGALNAEVFIQASKKDLHSGTFGGCVGNAAVKAGEFIQKLHKQNHSIAIPGFYDDVIPVTEEERRFMQLSGLNDNQILMDAETQKDWGEKAYSLYERTTIRPSLSVTGITSGFQGKGVKNVIPSTALVKLNFRLVPNQQPEKVQALFDNFLKSILPAPEILKTAYSSFANPVTVSRNNHYINAATMAYEKVFRRQVKLIRAGGTISAVDFIANILHVPVVLMGFAQATDNMHAPDEKMFLPNFFRGIETSKLFIENVGLLKPGITCHEGAGNKCINSKGSALFR